MDIHIHRQGNNYGPYSLEAARAYLVSGTLSAMDLAWHEGASDWVLLSTIPGIQVANQLPLPASAAPGPVQASASANAALPSRSSGGIMRWVLFFGVNLAVVSTIYILLNVFGIDSYLDADGINLEALVVFSMIVGFSGAGFCLLISRWMAKKLYAIRVIADPADETQRWLLSVVTRQARTAGIPVPELGIYESKEVNAFATGPSRRSSLVALSSSLLKHCEPHEVEAVMGHEIGHIAAGDMVTMALLQGVLNTFVVFVSRIFGYVASTAVKNKKGSQWANLGVSFALQLILGVAASLLLMAYSRRREFRADAFSAGIQGREAMIAALRRLRSISPETCLADARGASMAAFKISASNKKRFSLFDSHPPLEERIAKLEELQ